MFGIWDAAHGRRFSKLRSPNSCVLLLGLRPDVSPYIRFGISNMVAFPSNLCNQLKQNACNIHFIDSFNV